MYFVAETSGTIPCRLMYDAEKCKQYNEIPYSKLLGFISNNIFETIRSHNKDFEFVEKTMEEIFIEYPIEYSFVYKNNREYNQGINANVGDYQPTEGSGQGSKPSVLNRLFNKQIIIIFKFVDEPPWLETFKNIWLKRPIFLKGTMSMKKTIVPKLEDVTFEYDVNKIYYTYSKFTKAQDDILNPFKMLFMFNKSNISKSIYIENIEDMKFISAFSIDDILSTLQLKTTSETISK